MEAAIGPRPMADARVGQQGTHPPVGAPRQPAARRPRHPLPVGPHLRRGLSGARDGRRPRDALRRHPGDERAPRRDRPHRRGAHAILVLVLVLVLDGAGCHGAGALIVPDNLSLVTLPPFAPELNPIENVRACLRGNKLAITAFGSYDAIVAKCCEAWNFFANAPSTVASITSRGWAEVSS
jgi:hypothetical protein